MPPSLVSLPGPAADVRRSRLEGRISEYRTPLLPQNSVRASFQDRRDYLWFGTEEGVVRFDGTEWKSYRIREGLVSNFVQCIAEDRFGCLWIGTRIGGLSRFDPMHASDAWRSFGIAEGLPDVDVRAIAATADGSLWIATRGGLAHLDPATSRLTLVNDAPAASEELSALLVDGADCLWVGSRRRGLSCFDPSSQSWRSFSVPSGRITSLAADRDGAIWAGTRDSGLARVTPSSGRVDVFDVQHGLPDNRVLSLLCDRGGDLWIGMERGGVTCMRLAAGAAREFAFLPVDEGLTDYMTMSILEDRNGSYWLGSLAGLTLFEPEGSYRAKTWGTYTHDHGLGHNLVTAIHHDAQRRFWFGSYGGGVSVLTGREAAAEWETFDTGDGLSHDVVRAIAEDAAGRLWFGTFGGGLSRFDPRSRAWRTFTTADGLAGDVVRTIKPDRRGMFWAGTDGGGISVFDPLAEVPAFCNATTADGLPSNRVGTILHDSRGRVWAGTYEGGAAILEHGQWRRIDKSDGLPANDVYCIAEDPAGRFWIGTGGSGIARFDGDTWRVFTERDGLPNDTIYQVLVESEQSIYASTNRGVFRLRFEGSREVIVGFDRTDGVADDECNGGASLRDRDGRFWIGTLSGVSFIDPRDVPERILPCAVYVNGFFVHDEPMDLQGVNAIEDSKHEFAFTYGAVEYVSSQKVRYRTWLEGFDTQWSKVTAERAIRYTNLKPGRYCFKVQARNWGGEWSEPAELAFEVVPDPERLAREETQERERIDKKVLETAHSKLQQLAAELRDANQKLQEKEVQLEMQAREDALTGVLNRRYLDIQLQREFDRAVRFKRPLTVVMADLDHFKSINDRFSHAVGDDVLRIAARLIRTAVRSVDVVARYGGEEFALLLPETPLDLALLVCEKIRHAIAAYPWSEVHPELQLTASFGCADDTAAGPLQMLHAADQMLFEAKRSGRNRVSG